MVLAVVDDDAQVRERVARDRAFEQHLTHAFLDGRDVLRRNRAADDLAHELEARAARRAARRAGTPRRTGPRRRSASCGGCGRPRAGRSSRGTRSSAAASRPRARSRSASARARAARAARPSPRSTVSFTWGSNSIFRLGSSTASLCSASESFFSWPRCFKSIATPMHRRRQLGRAQAELVLVVARVQHVAEMQIFDLRDRAEVARDRRGHFAQLLALHRVEMRELHGLALVADEHLIARVDLALVHAQRREPPDVRIDVELEHVADEVARRRRARRRCELRPSRPAKNSAGLPSNGFGMSSRHHAQQLPQAPRRSSPTRSRPGSGGRARSARSNGSCRSLDRAAPRRARGSDP